MLPALAITLAASLAPPPALPTTLQAPAPGAEEVEQLRRALHAGDRRERLEAIAALPAHGAEAVPALAEALSDRVLDVRREAARALGGLGALATPAAGALVAAGSDEHEDVRREAWRALGRLGPGAAGPLAQAAVDLGPPGSLRALLALGRLEPDAPEVLAAALPVLVREGATQGERAAAVAIVVRAGAAAHLDLAEALVHPAWEARAAAATALGTLELDDARVRGALISAAADTDAAVRRRAVWALGRHRADDPAALATLAKRLEDESVDVQRAAVWALGRAGAAGVPALLSVEHALWDHAVTALGALEPEDASDLLFEYIESEETPVERALSALIAIQRWGPRARHLAPRLARLLAHSRTWMRIAALHALNWTGYDEPAIADLLELALQSEDPRVRAPAATALGHATARPDTTVLTLVRMLAEDPEAIVRQDVAWVLGGFGQHPDQVVPALLEALGDADATVRREAAHSLEELGPRAFPAAERLARALLPAEDDAGLAEAAHAALLAMDSEAKPALMQLVRSAPDLELAAAALRVLLEGGVLTHAELREISRDERVLVQVLATVGLLRDGLSPTKAVQTFIDGVKDRHEAARVEGARGLASLGATARTALSALTHALERSPPPVRIELVGAIAAVAGDRRSGVQALVEVLEEDPDVAVRASAARLLGDLGEDARRALPALIEALESEDAGLRAAALAGLAGLEPDTRSAAEAVCARLEEDGSPAVRRAAALALGRLPAPQDATLDALRAALEDVEVGVAAGAALGLGELGAAATGDVPRLVDQLLSHPDLTQRAACADALAELGPLAYEATPALSFTVLFEEETTRLDPLLSLSLDAPAPPRPIDAEQAGGETTWLDLRVAAARALGAIGPDAALALPALNRAVESGDPRLAETGLQAIARVRP